MSRGQHVHAKSDTRNPDVSSARVAHTEHSRDDDFASFSKAFALYQQNQNRQRPERAMYISNNVFNLLRDKDPEFLQSIFDIRQKLEKRAEELQDTQPNTPNTPKQDQGQQRIDVTKQQYDRRAQPAAKANLTTLAEVDNMSDTDYGTDGTDGTDTDAEGTAFTPDECEKAIAFINAMRGG